MSGGVDSEGLKFKHARVLMGAKKYQTGFFEARGEESENGKQENKMFRRECSGFNSPHSKMWKADNTKRHPSWKKNQGACRYRRGKNNRKALAAQKKTKTSEKLVQKRGGDSGPQGGEISEKKKKRGLGVWRAQGGFKTRVKQIKKNPIGAGRVKKNAKEARRIYWGKHHRVEGKRGMERGIRREK